MRGSGRVFAGLLLFGAGGLLLLDMMGYVDVSIGELLGTYWPCFLILAGLSQLSHGYRNGGALFSGLIVTAIGGYFLARNTGYISLSVGDFFRAAVPILLILGGLSVLFKPSRNRRSHRERRDSYTGDVSRDYRPHPKGNEGMVPPPPPSPEEIFSGTSVDQAFEQAFPQEKPKHGTQEEPRKFDAYTEQRYQRKDEKLNRSGFIGDVRIGDQYFELKPTNISHFIGDTIIDLTKAQIPYGETKINISAFIGDVKVFVPADADLGISVSSNSLIGDMKVLKEDHGGFMSSVSSATPNYHETSKRVKLNVSVFVGDIRINTVG